MDFMTRQNISDETVKNILEDGWILHSINILPYTSMLDNRCTRNSIEREFYFIKDDADSEIQDEVFKSALKELIQVSEYRKNKH